MKNVIKVLEKKLEYLFEKKDVPKYLSGKGKVKNITKVLEKKVGEYNVI